MSSTRLPNYLRSNRKRLGLSQDEVAFLLGTQSGAKVCRYEKFERIPSLETALALEAIFKKPVSELFAGLYAEIEDQVAGRAKALTHQTHYHKPGRGPTRKLQTLTNIAAPRTSKTLNLS